MCAALPSNAADAWKDRVAADPGQASRAPGRPIRRPGCRRWPPPPGDHAHTGTPTRLRAKGSSRSGTAKIGLERRGGAYRLGRKDRAIRATIGSYTASVSRRYVTTRPWITSTFPPLAKMYFS
jgi:hypothetical protein